MEVSGSTSTASMADVQQRVYKDGHKFLFGISDGRYSCRLNIDIQLTVYKNETNA